MEDAQQYQLEMLCLVCGDRFVVMHFMSSQAAKQASDDMKSIREDLKISTEDGAAFPSKSALIVLARNHVWRYELTDLFTDHGKVK